jgi:hypothetical protein
MYWATIAALVSDLASERETKFHALMKQMK